MSGEAVSLPVPRLLTADEVAEILGVSRAQAYLLKDRIGYVVVGARAVRFEADAVFAYVHAQRRCHAPALASTATRSPLSGKPATPTPRAGRSVSPRVAEIMAQRRRGSRPVN